MLLKEKLTMKETRIWRRKLRLHQILSTRTRISVAENTLINFPKLKPEQLVLLTSLTLKTKTVTLFRMTLAEALRRVKALCRSSSINTRASS